jgi:SAM-dependent methyltransferase
MKLSIFTPTHDPKHLVDVYKSIKDQAFDEWVVLYNNGAKPIGFLDARVKEIWIDLPGSNIGALKKLACGNCTGDILLELDHDDLLTPDAIEEVRKAFEDPEVGFVYSNALYTDMDFGKVRRFDAEFGWQYRETVYDGHLLDEPLAFDLTPSSVSRIWFAPDHLRAFRKSVYEQVGGHNKDLEVLDDQDLMCRMYQVTKFHHIDKGLYVYRVHGENCWIQRNKKIQDGVYPLYDKYIEPLALAWAADSGLDMLDLGGRLAKQKFYRSVDLKDADVLCDLNGEWPFPDGSVGVVRAFDVFEHLKDPLHTMKELHRVLAPGGYAFIQVPSTDGRGAFQDPTHVSFWNENSFLYYTDRRWAQYVDNPVRFQALRVYTTEKDQRGVCWAVAHLWKLPEGVRVPGRVSI